MCGDASLSDSDVGAVPADIVLVCGVFLYSVGVHRLTGEPTPWVPHRRWFTFVANPAPTA